MKVTALIPNGLLAEVKDLTQDKNITDALITALNDWVAIQRIRRLNEEVGSEPLRFKEDFTAYETRNTNRTGS